MGAFVPPPGQPQPFEDGEFASGSVPNVVTFAFDGIDPPTAFYIQRDDVLVLEGFSTIANDILTLTARVLLPIKSLGGQPGSAEPQPTAPAMGGNNIVTIQRTLLPLTGGLFTATQIPLTEGYLLSVSITGSTATQRGMTFARAFIVRGTPLVANAFPNTTMMLVADYVTGSAAIGWPAGRTVYPTEGPGNVSSWNVGNPAAGADWSKTIGSGTRWLLRSLNAQLVTSAAVANRVIRSQLLDGGGNLVFQGAPSAVVPASTTVQVTANTNMAISTVDGTTIAVPLPVTPVLSAGFRVQVNTLALQAGDQWSNIWLYYEGWLDTV